MSPYMDELQSYQTVRPEVVEALASKAACEIREACRMNEIDKELKKQKLKRRLQRAKGKYC